MNDFASAPTQPLWTRANAMFARAVDAVGNAASIASLDRLPRALRRAIVGWLNRLECIVRRLLMAEAAELHRTQPVQVARGPRVVQVELRGLGLARHGPPPDAGPHAHPVKQCLPERPPHNLDRPETWRASFSFALPRPLNAVTNANAPRIRALWGPIEAAPPPPAARVIKSENAAFRLARRFEALRRVLENPRPQVERLLDALRRGVRRIPRFVQRYVWSGPRTNDIDTHDPRLSLDALALAIDTPDLFENSS